MTTWLRIFAERLLHSLWFVPALMALAAALLALVCAALDRSVAAGDAEFALLYRGDVESARTVLSTVAGSMITVAGVSFSVTMVALSLASSQLGPRLLLNFMRDRGNQVVLGGFIGTFLFCLLALGSTTSESGKVDSVSVSVALGMAVGSLLLLIYFIHHIATSMQADQVIRNVAVELDRGLQRIFVEAAPPAEARARLEGEPEAAVCALRKGYLQGVDENGLLRVASEGDLQLRLRRRPGHYVAAGAVLVEVYRRQGPRSDSPRGDDDDSRGDDDGARADDGPRGYGGPRGAGESVDDKLEDAIRRAFLIGGRRTPEQDPEYGVHQLVEIAVRALSPGVNDPFTAIGCIDHLSGILAGVAPLPERPPVRCDDSGTLRVVLDPIDFTGVLDAGFNQIRQSSGGLPAVAIRLLEALATIAAATSDPARLRALMTQGRMVYEAHAEALRGVDRESLDDRFERLRERAEPSAGA